MKLTISEWKKKTRSKVTFVNQAGWRNVGDRRIYFRSRWEYLFANYLEWQKKNQIITDWEYEPKTFWFEGIKRGVVSYKPDFRVSRHQGDHILSEWYEVKGFMDKRSQTKLKRFRAYFPNEKITVIDKKWFVSRAIKFDS